MMLQQLKYIIEIAELGSMSKAAQRMFVSQPNLSKTIAAFEQENGVVIFKRTNKGVELTEQGRLIYRQAKSIIAQSITLKNVCAQGSADFFEFGVATNFIALTTFVLSECYTHYAMPNKLILKCGSIEQIISAVKSTACDIALAVVEEYREKSFNKLLDYNELEFIKLDKDYLQVMAGSQSKLYEEKEITNEKLGGMHYVCGFAKGDEISNFDIDLVISEMCNIENTLELGDSYTASEMLKNNNCFSVGTRWNKLYIDKSIRFIPFKDIEMEVVLGAIKRKNIELNSQGYSFINNLKQKLAK